eukprot:5983089-Alexandrium_andersonii.AAC.1
MFAIESGSCYDEQSERVQPIPRCNIWIVGFECDSISSLNKNASKNRGCGETAAERTGRTLAATIAYAEKFKPDLCVFEIVKNVFVKPKEKDPGTDGLSVYETLVAQMNQASYLVSSEVLNACDFGAPQNRQRAWIFAVRQPSPVDQAAKGFADPPWFHAVRATL